MQETVQGELTVREYARQEGITIQTAYRRIWDGQVKAKQILGRWLICPDATERPQSVDPIPMTA